MRAITHHGSLAGLRRTFLILVAVAYLSLLTSCDQTPPTRVLDTNHVQSIATFLGDFAREILAAYLL